MDNMKNFETVGEVIEALDELIGWIDESNYSDDVDPRFTSEEWRDAESLADSSEEVAQRVNFLRRVPWTQVLLPDGQ